MLPAEAGSAMGTALISPSSNTRKRSTGSSVVATGCSVCTSSCSDMP